MRNVIWAAAAADQSLTTKSTHHIDLLVQMIENCGVTFRVNILVK